MYWTKLNRLLNQPNEAKKVLKATERSYKLLNELNETKRLLEEPKKGIETCLGT